MKKFLLLGLFFLVGCGGAPDKSAIIRVGYFPNITHAQALIGLSAEHSGFKKAFAEIAIDAKTFNAGPEEIEALFAGELDLAYIGPNPAINGYVKSRGEAVRIIAGAMSGGAALVTRADANISSPKDLAGRRVATPQLGNTQDVALRYFLLANNLAPVEKGGSVTVVLAQNPDIQALFLKKEIDAAWVPEPWGARLVREAGGNILLDERDLWQPNRKFMTACVVVSPKFLREHPDLVRRWLTVHVELTQWINANPGDAKRLANAEIARLTGKDLAMDILDDAWSRLDVTYDPLSSSLFVSADRAFALGFLGKAKPDLVGIYELSLLNQVLAEKKLPLIK